MERIAHHTPGTDALHYAASWVKQCDTYRGGVGKYYLEGKREFLSAPTEWHYEPATREALWIPPPGEAGPPAGASGRAVDFSLNISNCSFVTFANFSMFATALSVDNQQEQDREGEVEPIPISHHLLFDTLELNYTTTNRAVVGDLSPPVGMTVWAPTTVARRAPATSMVCPSTGSGWPGWD